MPRYAGTGYTQCRKCGMFDHRQLTNGVPNGVACTGGVLNGTVACCKGPLIGATAEELGILGRVRRVLGYSAHSKEEAGPHLRSL